MDEKKMTLEERFDRLDTIIAEMESEETTLDQSFELYKKGLEQIREANRTLDTIEKAMLVIGADGSLQEFE